MFLTLLMSVVLDSPAIRRPEVIKVDVIEINEYRIEGSGGITQVLFWDWSPDYRRHHCQGWSLADKTLVRKVGEKYVASVHGREIEAPILRVTKTDYDPERRNQELFPSKFRRKLW